MQNHTIHFFPFSDAHGFITLPTSLFQCFRATAVSHGPRNPRDSLLQFSYDFPDHATSLNVACTTRSADFLVFVGTATSS